MLTSVIAKKFNIPLPTVNDDLWTIEPPNPPTREEAEAFIKGQQYWYYCMYLGNGIYTRRLRWHRKYGLGSGQRFPSI
jgi:hypothetical protein